MSSKVKFECPSISSPEETIQHVLQRNLHMAKPTQSTIERFNSQNDTIFICEVISINYYLNELIGSSCHVDDVTKAIETVKTVMHETSKRLKTFQRSSSTATPQNIYLNKLHSAYGMFLLEFNTLVDKIMLHISQSKLTPEQLESFFNEPYRKSSHTGLPAIVGNGNSQPPPPLLLLPHRKVVPFSFHSQLQNSYSSKKRLYRSQHQQEQKLQQKPQNKPEDRRKQQSNNLNQTHSSFCFFSSWQEWCQRVFENCCRCIGCCCCCCYSSPVSTEPSVHR